ncbi:hypothetical protein LCGC14_0872770 [marine sediment metagenome]|uniref:Uncharacterized protein n=1 Tax=marine sediment metagenome TaxID=412755 RepID=A0A0F9SB78_9ZZZZ
MKRSQFLASIAGLITTGCSGFSTKPPPVEESAEEIIMSLPDDWLAEVFLKKIKSLEEDFPTNERDIYLACLMREELLDRNFTIKNEKGKLSVIKELSYQELDNMSAKASRNMTFCGKQYDKNMDVYLTTQREMQKRRGLA